MLHDFNTQTRGTLELDVIVVTQIHWLGLASGVGEEDDPRARRGCEVNLGGRLLCYRKN